MNLKDEYVEKLKAQLDEWSADIDKLEVQAHLAKAELKDNYAKHLAELRAIHNDAASKINQIQNATEGAWEELKKGGEGAWSSIVNAMTEARKKFKD
ncbi:MAG TPA: hypothetical protein PLR90_08435 [Methylophilus sp.]|nr:hypothetical protein [Methylophilus sp.]HQQ33932.1 hypothetical protein [Methylophilus sp.]